MGNTYALKKIIPSLFVLLFIWVFWYFYGDEYASFQQESQEVRQKKVEIENEIQDFSVTDIRELDSVEFYHTPNLSLLDTIVSKINLADKRVYIEVYIFTEKRIKSAIKNAHERWVDVRIILEKNPYLAPRLNDSLYSEIEKTWIDIVWSDSRDYALNHSKLMIIDDEVIISTWNISYSTFAYNKDFFIVTDDRIIRENMLYVFENDFLGRKISPYEPNIVLSPVYARDKFTALFEAAQSSIQMYFQYFQDVDLESVFLDKIDDWVEVSALVSENFANNNIDKARSLQESWISIKYIKKPKMHAKAILIDEKYLFIGSVNFSSYSLDANREVGILIENPDIISQFLSLFKQDYSQALNIK